MLQGKFSNIINIFLGMNVADTPDVITKKGQATFILNCYNYPTGGVAKLFGRQKHNAVAIAGSPTITGLYSLETIADPTFYCVAGAKIYLDSSGTWDDITGAMTISNDPNNLSDFINFEDVMIRASYDYDQILEHDGIEPAAVATPNAPAGRYLGVLADQLFVFNTEDQPKLGYWSGIDDRTSWDLGNDFMNFKSTESDNDEITGVKEHLDTLVVTKGTSLFRLYATGTVPAFQYYVITPGIGCVSHYSIQNVPPCGKYPERLIWMGVDNFYQLEGDNASSIGDDIQPFFSEGAPFQINLSRAQFTTSGLIQEKNLYWCAFSSGSNTENDYIFVLDYKNMQWALCNFAANCFCIRTISGRKYLYSGRYDGFAAQHNTGIYDDCGVGYTSQMYFPWLDFGDTQLQKKLRYLVALFDATGTADLTFEYRTDLQTDSVTLDMVTGAGLLGINFILGTTALGGVTLLEQNAEIIARCKRVQFLISDNGTADQYFRLLACGILWDKVRGYRMS